MASRALQGWVFELKDESNDDENVTSIENNESDIDLPTSCEDSDESDVDLNLESPVLDTENDVKAEPDSEMTECPEWSCSLAHVLNQEFEQLQGPLHDLDANSKAIDYFDLFITPDMIEKIVLETNRYADKCRANKEQLDLDENWKPVTSEDILKFLYVNIMFGVHKLPHYNLYWSTDPLFRVPAVADTMAWLRFVQITQYFHLNDSQVRPQEGDKAYDPLYKIQPLLDSVRASCKQMYKPGRNINIVEAVIGLNGRIFCKLSGCDSKPTKRGMKLLCVVEESTGYLLNFSFITEKVTNDVGHHFVFNAAMDYLDKFHCFYFDKNIASVKLAEDLLKRDTYISSNISPTSNGWPLGAKKKNEQGECNMLQKGQLVATQWTDGKTVNILSTCCQTTLTEVVRRSKDGVVKRTIPTPVHNYNTHMGGAGLAQQYRSYYDVGTPGEKRWRQAFWFLIQTAIVNGFLLMRASNPNHAKWRTTSVDHLQFRMELCRNLLERASNSNPTSRPTSVPYPFLADMAEGGDSSLQHKLVRFSGRKRTCYQCSKTKTKTKSGYSPETVFGCEACGINLCKGHCFAQFHSSLK